jgi:hypothetical protein
MFNQNDIVNENNYFESKKQVVKNNYWNDDHEHILESLQKSCFRLSKEYKQKYFKLRDRLQLYRIPIIIISSIGGFLSLSNSGYIPPLYNKWISLFVGFTNLTVTIISLIESFKKIDTRMNGSYNTYVNFQKLHDEISIIKRIPRNERPNNGNDTINELFTKYASYISDAPILRKLINDDIGLNEFNEIITPQYKKISSSTDDVESQLNQNKILTFLNKEKILNSLNNKKIIQTNNNINLYNEFNELDNENNNFLKFGNIDMYDTKILNNETNSFNKNNNKIILPNHNDTNQTIKNNINELKSENNINNNNNNNHNHNNHNDNDNNNDKNK